MTLNIDKKRTGYFHRHVKRNLAFQKTNWYFMYFQFDKNSSWFQHIKLIKLIKHDFTKILKGLGNQRKVFVQIYHWTLKVVSILTTSKGDLPLENNYLFYPLFDLICRIDQLVNIDKSTQLTIEDIPKEILETLIK